MSSLATPIRKNDNVLVITGKDRGKRGRVLKVNPEKNRLVVEGVNMIKRFLSGFTLSTRPRLPRSLPVMMSTLSFFRIGVARLDITDTCNSEF